MTLIEVLSVTAIIGLLLAVLLPSLATARSAARGAVCQARLHQWGVALGSYLNTAREHIPRRGQGIQVTALIDRKEDWFNCLPVEIRQSSYRQLMAARQRPEAGNDSLFICPSALPVQSYCFFSYAMNMYLSPWNRPRPHRLTEISRPATTAFMADAPGPYSSTIPSDKLYSVVARHGGRAGVVFLDGRVELFRGDYLGCGRGLPDPERGEVNWRVGTASDQNVPYGMTP